VALYAGAVGGGFAPIAGGPAEAGAPPTRVALSCRGTGTLRIASLRVAAAG
jgi:hypothetical protein